MAVLKSAMDDLILASGRAHKEFISNSSVGPLVFVCSILRLVFILYFRPHHYAWHKVQPIVTDYCRLSVCLLARSMSLQKQLNRLRCRLDC